MPKRSITVKLMASAKEKFLSVFRILKENLFSSFLICSTRTNNHSVTLLHVSEKLGCPVTTKHGKDQGMGFDQ